MATACVATVNVVRRDRVVRMSSGATVPTRCCATKAASSSESRAGAREAGMATAAHVCATTTREVSAATAAPTTVGFTGTGQTGRCRGNRYRRQGAQKKSCMFRCNHDFSPRRWAL